MEGNKVFFGGCDGKVFLWDPVSNSKLPAGEHNKAVKFIKWTTCHNLLLTGGWDKTLKFWDGRQSTPVLTVPLPDRLYCADACDEVGVFATADRNILIFDLKNQKPYCSIKSPLKFQSRSCKIFRDKQGFALGSIEGKVAIHNILDQSKNFNFQCHRDNGVHAVNDIAFHNSGIFATCGSDGNLLWWNKDQRALVKRFQKCSLPITNCAWNFDGSIFSYSVGYDWSKGTKYAIDNQQNIKTLILLAPHQI